MKNVSEIEKLEKKLEKLEEKDKAYRDKIFEKKCELRDKIESLQEDEAKKKVGEKFYNKVVHITKTIPYWERTEHYIGVINPDTICSQGFYMYKYALYVRIENNVIETLFLYEHDGCGVDNVNPNELFKNETVTYGNKEKCIFTIKLASKKDSEFIQQVFETKKKQDNAKMDKLRDFCISMFNH